ncbi:hypothetical protein IT407_04520 [Candidatus Uhrbacteria bacterium]|nr:hypothetical protein [Candidatus Uhrbacteria bacterium]
MRKTFSSLLLVLVAAAPMFSFAAPTAQAATINTAIRGQSQLTVYWYANDGKRYTFPNANTYFTWLPSFDTVINLTDAELASIPLGNQNITYRPGAKLVKIVSDPKVYAVSKGGVLRHVTSESLAIQLYGQDWNLNVHDVPVEFFTNYTVGSPIYSASDYFVGTEYNSVSNPADSFRTNIGNGTQNGLLNLTADRTSINPGQAVNLVASVPAGYANGYVRIYDLRNGTQIASCTTYSYASSCNQTVYPQRINTGDTQVQYEVRLLDVNGNRISSAFGPVIYFSTTSGSSSTFTGTRFITTVSRTTANHGDSVTLTAQLTNQNGLTSNYRIEIQDPRNNTALHNCWNTSYCQISTNISLPSGQSSVNFRARLFDASGALVADEIFPLISLYSTGTGTLAFTSDRTNITSGQAVYLSATYNTNLPSGGRIELKEIRTGNLVKACYDSSTCSATVYPTQASGYTSTQYVANVLNSSGSLIVSMNGPVIYFDGNNQTGSLTLTADRTSITAGQAVTLYASYSGTLPSGGRLEIKRDRSNEIVTTCYNSSCNITVYPRADAGMTIDQYYVTVVNASGNSIVGTQYGPVINIGGTTSGPYENDGVNYINGLTLQADRTNINRGDSVTLTANAFNVGNWSYIGNRIEIRDVRNGFNVVKTCSDQSWCTISLPVYGMDGIAQYEARIWDRLNRLVLTQNGPVIYVSGSTSNGGNTNTGSASVTLESNRTSITSGETVTLTARSFNAAYDTRLEIYDNRTGSLAGSCSNTSVCPISIIVSRRNSDETNAQFYAVLKNLNGAEIARQFGPVIAFTGTGSTGGTGTGTGTTLTGTTDIYVSPSSNLRPNNTVYVTASVLNPSTAVQNMIIRVYTESNGLLGTCNGVTVCSLPFQIGPSGVNTRTYAQFSATDRSNTIETSRINLIAN